MKIKKISVKLMLAVIALVAVTIISIAIPSYYVIVSESDKVLSEQMSERVMCAWDVADGLNRNAKSQDEAKSEFKKYILSRAVGKNGYGYVVDSTGVGVYHPDQSEVGKSLMSESQIKEMVSNISTFTTQDYGMSKVKVVYYTHNGKQKFAYYTYYQKWDMIIALSGNLEDFTGAKDKAMLVLFGVGGLVLVIGSVLTLIISRRATKPISNVVNAMEEVEKGNLKIENVPVKSDDELGMLSKGFNSMLNNFSAVLLDIKGTAEIVESQSEHLTSISEELSSSSQEVSNAVQEVAQGASSQAEQLSTVNNYALDFGKEVTNIAAKIDQVGENALNINSMAKDSSNQLQSMADSVEDLNVAFGELIEKIAQFGEDVNKVNEITDVINSIADQTNLLALNAAIEAARAGEAGKGFAVVAEEIRKLAEQSKISSSNIKKLLDGINYTANVVENSTKHVNEELSNQIHVAKASMESFKEIIAAIGNILPQISAINESAAIINTEKDEIIVKVENVSSVSEETSAAAQQIAASSQEMNMNSEEVANSAEKLAGATRDMISEINRFNL
ncbi:MAG: methyl-accepting chemotaxis protein [Bacillota bacterium]|nr:methyl-accepting chemotaxis protein [Bacillota bacterium]